MEAFLERTLFYVEAGISAKESVKKALLDFHFSDDEANDGAAVIPYKEHFDTQWLGLSVHCQRALEKAIESKKQAKLNSIFNSIMAGRPVSVEDVKNNGFESFAVERDYKIIGDYYCKTDIRNLTKYYLK